MKTDTEILTSIATTETATYLHQLSVQESEALKKMLLLMYKDFVALCEKHDISFMLGGGSCLGAVRHKGFIPWDDDLDIMMVRRDYEKLISILAQGALGAEYEVNYPSKATDCKNTFLKIYRKGTLDNELCNENTPFPNGVFLDIFPIDNAPENNIVRRLKGFVSDSLQFISVCVLYAQYPSEKFKKFSYLNKDSKKRFRIRMAVGKLFKVIPHRKWVYWFDLLHKSADESRIKTIPTGRKHYCGEAQPADVFMPVKYMEFEKMMCPVPNNWDAYLKSLYGDYMQLPPENKRERHLVYQFKCDFVK